MIHLYVLSQPPYLLSPIEVVSSAPARCRMQMQDQHKMLRQPSLLSHNFLQWGQGVVICWLRIAVLLSKGNLILGILISANPCLKFLTVMYFKGYIAFEPGNTAALLVEQFLGFGWISRENLTKLAKTTVRIRTPGELVPVSYFNDLFVVSVPRSR